jgi:hypothetical protein
MGRKQRRNNIKVFLLRNGKIVKFVNRSTDIAYNEKINAFQISRRDN